MRDLRITIDPVACDAYGYCAEILPEVIGLDEWGYPIIRDGPLDSRPRRLGQTGGPGLSEASPHAPREAGQLSRVWT